MCTQQPKSVHLNLTLQFRFYSELCTQKEAKYYGDATHLPTFTSNHPKRISYQKQLENE